MKTLETDRLVIRPFVFDDADEYRRLLDEAFGHESYGAEDTTRLLLEYHVIADKAHDALHQTPYEDRAIVRRSDAPAPSSARSTPSPGSSKRTRRTGRSARSESASAHGPSTMCAGTLRP